MSSRSSKSKRARATGSKDQKSDEPILKEDALKKLSALLSKKRSQASTKELESVSKQLRALADECDAIHASLHVNPEEMKQWEEAWTEELKQARLVSDDDKCPYDDADIERFVEAISASIVLPPSITTYVVRGKHGSRIQYDLASFETQEKDGTRQKILAARYDVDDGYEKDSWTLTSRESLKEECSFQQHLKNIEAFRVPDTLPPGAPEHSYETKKFFWSEDEGIVSADDCFYVSADQTFLPLQQVLETKKMWQIVLALTPLERFV